MIAIHPKLIETYNKLTSNDYLYSKAYEVLSYDIILTRHYKPYIIDIDLNNKLT